MRVGPKGPSSQSAGSAPPTSSEVATSIALAQQSMTNNDPADGLDPIPPPKQKPQPTQIPQARNPPTANHQIFQPR